MKLKGRKVAPKVSGISTQDTIRIHGEVETIAYYPEYKDQIGKILDSGKGSPQDNWMPDGEWAWQERDNAVVDGLKVLAASITDEPLAGFQNTAPNYSRTYLEDEPNKYLNRPVAIRIKDATSHYYTRWLRGDNEKNGSINTGGDEYARYICEIPDADTDSHPSDADHPWFNGHEMSIDQIDLMGAYQLSYGGGKVFDATPATALIGSLSTHIAYPALMVCNNDAATRTQPAIYDYPTDYILDSDRHNITFVKQPASDYGVFAYYEVLLNMTLEHAAGNIFSTVSLSSKIPKDDLFYLAIVWKILFT